MQKYDYILLLAAFLFTGSYSTDITTEEKDGFNLVSQSGGPSLGYSLTSGVNLITEKGYAFKDLNRNGKLDAYEDWRLPVDERAQDLASQMTVEQIAGLMLYSAH